MPHPVGGKVKPSAITTRLGYFFYHFFAIYLKFDFGFGILNGEVFALFGFFAEQLHILKG